MIDHDNSLFCWLNYVKFWFQLITTVFSRGTLLFLLLVHSLFFVYLLFPKFYGSKAAFLQLGLLGKPGISRSSCQEIAVYQADEALDKAGGRSADRRSGEQVGQSTAAEPGRGNCWERRGQGLKKSVVSPWFHHGFTNRKDGKIKMLVLMFFVGETMWNHHFWCLLGINHHVFWCLSLSAALNGSILTIISIIEWV